MSTEPDDLGFPLPAAGKTSRLTVLVVVAVIVGGAFTFGYLRQRKAHGEVPVVSGEPKATRVEVITATTLKSDRALSLPGTVHPLEQTQIYARVTGYVRSWKVDLGDKVTAGQLLAEIDTPEVDAQLSQARAQLAVARAAVTQATAQRDYSKSSSTRTAGLADQQLVSKAQVEQTQAQAATDEAMVTSAKSNVAAQEANVRRLVDLQQFSRVVAPFAGTVTTRSIDRGALVRDGATTPLFTVVAIDPVRVFVDVPQAIAPSVRPDTPATITVREFAGKPFVGKVTRSAGALDPELHTMMTEIQVPNPDGALMPGMYVQAALTLSVPHRIVELPATALYNDAQGVRVATVDATNHVKFIPITIERDVGATVQIASGLTGDERVIKIAVPSLLDGDLVEVASAPAKP
ncbi:MAG: efflux RND transporter periplasmic adaptor subunit [Myxococcales bacterium]|nr:efflux RND transporter periplasmic adaptor subunit [Myxococcales bacterium]